MFNLPQNESEIVVRAVFFLQQLKTNAPDLADRIDGVLSSFNPALVKGVTTMIDHAGFEEASPDNSILSWFALERVASKLNLSIAKVEKESPFPASHDILFVAHNVEPSLEVASQLLDASSSRMVKTSSEWKGVLEEAAERRKRPSVKVGF